MAKLDTEFKAYFLGLIMSDGYIMNDDKLGKYYVGLDMCDEDVIEFVSRMTNCPYKKYHRDDEITKNGTPKQPRYRVLFHGKKYVDELANYGVFPNKSKTIKGYNFKRSEFKFIPYVIRGLIDGDGWVRKDGKEFYICTGSEQFAYWLKDILEDHLYMTDLNIIYAANGTYTVRSSKAENIDILKTLV